MSMLKEKYNNLLSVHQKTIVRNAELLDRCLRLENDLDVLYHLLNKQGKRKLTATRNIINNSPLYR